MAALRTHARFKQEISPPVKKKNV